MKWSMLLIMLASVRAYLCVNRNCVVLTSWQKNHTISSQASHVVRRCKVWHSTFLRIDFFVASVFVNCLFDWKNNFDLKELLAILAE